jgi:hypothetical protein
MVEEGGSRLSVNNTHTHTTLTKSTNDEPRQELLYDNPRQRHRQPLFVYLCEKEGEVYAETLPSIFLDTQQYTLPNAVTTL